MATQPFCMLLLLLIGSSLGANITRRSYIISSEPQESNQVLQLIQSEQFKTCLLYVSFRSNVSYSLNTTTLNTPWLLDRQPIWGSKDSYGYQGEIITKYYDLLHENPQINRFRHTNCVLRIAFADLSKNSYDVIRPSIFHAYKTATLRPLPEYLVLADSIPSNGFLETADYTIRRRVGVAPGVLPAVFWVPRNLQMNSAGVLFCWYCGQRESTQFSCTDWNSCAANMMQTYENETANGGHAQWRLLPKMSFKQFPLGSHCQFSLKPRPCTLQEPDSVVHFLMEGLNGSSASSKYDHFENHRPFVSYTTESDLQTPVYTWMNGERQSFHFITADGISNALALGTLLLPFPWLVWVFLATGLLVTAMILGGLRPYRTMEKILGLFAAVLDQQAPSIMKKVALKAPTIILWLFCVFILGSIYKATLKATSMLEPSYDTDLKHLRQLRGFKLFFIQSASSSTNDDLQRYVDSCEETKWKYSMWTGNSEETDCESQYYISSCYKPQTTRSMKELPFCNIFKASLQYVEREGGQLCNEQCRNWYYRYQRDVRTLTLHVRVRNISYLDSVIDWELDKPRTAMVVSQDRFSAVWQRVKEAMLRKKVKFAWNRRTRDDHFLSFEPIYQISSGFSFGEDKNVVIKRAKVLMMSGIHGLWKEWERLRKRVSEAEGEIKGFLPLSLKNSDVFKVFQLLCICLLFDIVVGMAEGIGAYLKRRIVFV